MVDLKAPDGTILKASYFAAAKPGPGVLLFHQSNRDRKSWDEVAGELAAIGINTLTLDMRGFGESGGKKEARKQWLDGDLDAAALLIAQFLQFSQVFSFMFNHLHWLSLCLSSSVYLSSPGLN